MADTSTTTSVSDVTQDIVKPNEKWIHYKGNIYKILQIRDSEQESGHIFNYSTDYIFNFQEYDYNPADLFSNLNSKDARLVLYIRAYWSGDKDFKIEKPTTCVFYIIDDDESPNRKVFFQPLERFTETINIKDVDPETVKCNLDENTGAVKRFQKMLIQKDDSDSEELIDASAARLSERNTGYCVIF